MMKAFLADGTVRQIIECPQCHSTIVLPEQQMADVVTVQAQPKKRGRPIGWRKPQSTETVAKPPEKIEVDKP